MLKSQWYMFWTLYNLKPELLFQVFIKFARIDRKRQPDIYKWGTAI